MQNKTFTLIGAGVAVAAALTLTACGSSSNKSDSTTSMAPMSSSSMMTSSAMMSGGFMGLNGKKVSGHAELSGSTLTLSNFSSDEGPDLHVYLTNGTTENDVRAGAEISKVSYNTASQSFTVPASVNAGSYKDVVIHCDKALAVFGAAPLM